MRKISSYFLLFGMMCVMMSSCQHEKSRSSALDSSVVSSVSDELSLPKSESVTAKDNYDAMIYFGGINIPVIFAPEVKIDSIYIDEYWLNFSYDLGGGVVGNAHVPLTFGRMIDNNFENFKDPNFFKSISLKFDYNNGKTSLTVNWISDKFNLESEDTYLFDGFSNFWYRQWDNFDLSPALLTEEEVRLLFQNETPKKNKDYSTFFSSKPIYNVSFYRVSDFENEYGPDILLEHYDEYTNDDLFFWQTDLMYRWHLSIQYTDTEGNTHFFKYSCNSGVGYDETMMFEMDKPDWNIDIEGKVYIEE